MLYKPGGTSMLINELQSVATRCRVSRHDGSATTWQTGLVAPKFLLPGSAIAAGRRTYSNGTVENVLTVAQQKGNAASIYCLKAATNVDFTVLLNKLGAITTQRLGAQGLAVPVPSK